jgi:nitrogen fixation protein FixH
MSSSPAPSQRPLTGRHVLTTLIVFFGVIFVADGIMIYKAITTFGGLDTSDAYRKGLAYNDRIAAERAQAARGWQDKIAFDGDTRRLRVALNDTTGIPVSGRFLTAHLQRPATDRFDHELRLKQTGPGTYEASASELDTGWWTMRLQVHGDPAGDGDVLYESRRRLWIKP